MKFIIEHGEKVLTVVIVVLCAAFIATKLNPGADTAAEKLTANSEKIDRILKKGEVPDTYRWHTSKKTEYSEVMSRHMARPTSAGSVVPEPYLAYPRPPRPFVDPEMKPKELPKEVEEAEAACPPPAGITAKGDHGSVYVAVRLPKGLEFMVPVRIDVYRGEDAKKVEQLVGSIAVSPEEGADLGAAAAEEEEEPEAEEAPAEAAGEVEDNSGKSARARKKDEPAEEKAEPEDVAGPDHNVDVPAEYKDYYVLRDAPVKPKTEYFYAARLVCKLAPANNSGYIVKDGKQYEVTVPETLTPANPTKEGSKAKLYASALTDVVSDRTPPNFILRFSGVIGELPDPNVPLRFQGVPSYQGNFEMKVWVPKAYAWKTATIQTPVNEVLKGDIRYQNYQTKAWEIFTFDTGYKLTEIKSGFDRVMDTKTVPVMKKVVNEAGEEVEMPEVDEVTGRPKMTTKQIERKVPTRVALLEDSATKEIEEHPQRQNFEARKENFVYFDRILKAQEDAQAKRKAAMKAVHK